MSGTQPRTLSVMRQARADALHQRVVALLSDDYSDPSWGVALSALYEEFCGAVSWWTSREIQTSIEDLVAARRLVVEAREADIWLRPLPALPVRRAPPKRPPTQPPSWSGR